MTTKSNHKPRIELMKPDQPDQPLPFQTQQPLINALFGEDIDKIDLSPLTYDAQKDSQSSQLTYTNQTESKIESVTESQFTTTTSSSNVNTDDLVTVESSVESPESEIKKVSRVAPTTGDVVDEDIKKVSRVTSESEFKKVSYDEDVSDIKKVSHGESKRKPGRPKGSRNKKTIERERQIQLIPTPDVTAVRLNKDSIFYLRLYPQTMTVEELLALQATPVRRPAAEQFALNLLAKVAQGDPKSVDKYWNLMAKEVKSPEIPAKAGTNTSILDDILTSVEGEVFGENAHENA